MKKPFLTLSGILFLTLSSYSQSVILPERERAKAVDAILEDRLTNLLPQLMRRENIDMWVIISREYNEDPVMKTMLPSTWLSARRRTIMVFFDRGVEKGIEKLAIARYDVGTLLKGEWDVNVQPNQWLALAKVIDERNPKKIALNYSKDYGHADGLTFTEQKEFLDVLPEKHKAKITSADRLAVAWSRAALSIPFPVTPVLNCCVNKF